MANAILIAVVVAGSRENHSVSAFPTLSKDRETSAHTTTVAKTPDRRRPRSA